MRCYFMRDGHIAAVEVLDPPPSSDKEAVERSKELFRQRADKFETFEVWDRARVVYQHSGDAKEASKHAQRP